MNLFFVEKSNVGEALKKSKLIPTGNTVGLTSKANKQTFKRRCNNAACEKTEKDTVSDKNRIFTYCKEMPINILTKGLPYFFFCLY